MIPYLKLLLLAFSFSVATLSADALSEKEKLGSTYLQNGEWEKSYLIWIEVIGEDPCNKKALSGLAKIGKHWLQDPERKDEEVIIYEALTQCQPKNPDFLYYYGRALYQTGQTDKAEATLKQCLEIVPNYTDAEILLGHIAMQNGDLEKAKAIFQKYPDNPDAIAGMKGLEKKNRALRLAQARDAHANLNYSEALDHYSWLIQDDSDSYHYWPALFDVKSHTRPSIVVEANYTDAKENDPSLKAPVVKDYYFLNKVHLIIPIIDSWRLDLQQIYYHQRENDIYPPIGTNYSASSEGGEVMSQVYFLKYCRWDLSGRLFRMTGKQNDVGYPFKNTTRFEPGTTFFYNDGTNLVVLNAHRESYIIKNFTIFKSELLRTDYLTAGYAFKSKEQPNFEMEFWGNYIFIDDSLNNWKTSEDAMARINIPFPVIRDYFKMTYHFEHGHYDKLSYNYYSYKQQLRHTVGVMYEYNLSKRFYCNVRYEHRWQTTYQLFQPIGNFILIQNRQYLIANRVAGKISGQYKDKFKVELEGHLFHESLPYRDWNLKGSIVWQF